MDIHTFLSIPKASPQNPYVLITGSRDWDDLDIVKEELDKLAPSSILVHGGARGADKMAGSYWKDNGGVVIDCIPDWSKYGKSAGLQRNAAMLEDHPITSAIAFRKGFTRGTAHMV